MFFHTKKFQFGYILEGLFNGKCWYVHFTDIWNILLLFGIFVLH
jgi:hypothetical protein